MADLRISQAVRLDRLEPDARQPLACQSDPGTPCSLRAGGLFASLPEAGPEQPGVPFLARSLLIRPGCGDLGAVTPAALIGSVGAWRLAPGWLYLGVVETLTAAALCTRFAERFGRAPGTGALVTAWGAANSRLFLLAWDSAAGAWRGLDLDTLALVSVW